MQIRHASAQVIVCYDIRDFVYLGVAVAISDPLPSTVRSYVPIVETLVRYSPDGAAGLMTDAGWRSEEHTSELQSLVNVVCRLLL